MTVDPRAIDRLRGRIGRYGVWLRGDVEPDLARRVESLGYGAIWLGGSPAPTLERPRAILEATERIVVLTGIVPIWATPPETLAAAHLAVMADFPGRFVLGLGVSHPERIPDAAHPFDALVDYLDGLGAAGVQPEDMVLAALAPRMLRLAGERTVGAHPFLVTPRHSSVARGILGSTPLLAPEQRIALDADIAAARELARESVRTPYLGLTNYRRNLLRLGFSEDDLATASDGLVDALAGLGTAARAAARLREHIDAGADHVAVNLLGTADRAPGLADLAAALDLRA